MAEGISIGRATLVLTFSSLFVKSSGDLRFDDNCFDEECGRKYDPKGPLVHCVYL